MSSTRYTLLGLTIATLLLTAGCRSHSTPKVAPIPKATPSTEPSAAAPTSEVTFLDGNKFRYSIASSPLTSVASLNGVSAAPDNHLLTFTLKITNLQSDRPAPIPSDLQLLGPRQYVAPYQPKDTPPCFDPQESNAGADPLRGEARGLCYAQPTNGFARTDLETVTDLEHTQIPKSGSIYVPYSTSHEFPDSLPAGQTSLWAPNYSPGTNPTKPQAILVQVPQGPLIQIDGASPSPH